MPFSVFSVEGKKSSTCKHAEDAGAAVALLGDGATIRQGRRVLWTEGAESQPAGESYDHVADVVLSRVEAAFMAAHEGGTK